MATFDLAVQFWMINRKYAEDMKESYIRECLFNVNSFDIRELITDRSRASSVTSMKGDRCYDKFLLNVPNFVSMDRDSDMLKTM